MKSCPPGSTNTYSIARADYAQAIGAFRQIVDRYPFDTEAYYRLYSWKKAAAADAARDAPRPGQLGKNTP